MHMKFRKIYQASVFFKLTDHFNGAMLSLQKIVLMSFLTLISPVPNILDLCDTFVTIDEPILADYY